MALWAFLVFSLPLFLSPTSRCPGGNCSKCLHAQPASCGSAPAPNMLRCLVIVYSPPFAPFPLPFSIWPRCQGCTTRKEALHWLRPSSFNSRRPSCVITNRHIYSQFWQIGELTPVLRWLQERSSGVSQRPGTVNVL